MSKSLDGKTTFEEGWIKLHRSILTHPVFQDSELLHVFLYCLVKANHKPGRILSPQSEEGELTVERGQFIFGQRKAAKETGVNARTAHRKLVLLEKLGILSRSVSRRFTVVTVNNYSRYQDNPNQADPLSDSLVSHPCPTSVPLVSTNKNNKNEKNDKKKRKVFSFDSIEYELSQLLLTEIRKNDGNFLVSNPTAEAPSLQRWALQIDRLIRLDHRPPEEIRQVIVFAQTSSFWRSNILSAQKLREKYTTLLLQMKSQLDESSHRPAKTTNGKVHPCEIVI
ncbi:MAG TPA: hypothetical protein PL001_05035 [Candidatus Kryptobacter bacterium]|nr:hypothetical protein [Candidatus Kryptobacter bacterium]